MGGESVRAPGEAGGAGLVHLERPRRGGAVGGHGVIVLSGAVSRVVIGRSRANVNTQHRSRPQGGGDVSAWQRTGWATERERPAPNSAP